MELDELKASWQRLDQRVDELTAINRRLLTDDDLAQGALATRTGAGRRSAEHGHRRLVRAGLGQILERASRPRPARGDRGHCAACREHRPHRDRRGAAGAGAAHRLHAAGARRSSAALAIAAGVRGALISRGVVWLLGAVAGGIRHAGDGICGRRISGNAHRATCSPISWCAWRADWRRRYCTTGPVAAAAGSAARIDSFLLSHSIARARAAIAEIDEFARP